MPTYEYACTQCGHRFDVRQRFSDDPVSDCPECGASVRRVLYPAGVIFKGSGWYINDSRKSSASHSSSETRSESTGGTTSKSSSDAASAGSTDSKDTAKAAASS